MFEVGFSELCMVALVALLVIGPEKLPGVARHAGFWMGKSRRMIANLKAEAHAELAKLDMAQQAKQWEEIKQLEDLISDTDSALQVMNHDVISLKDELVSVESVIK